MRRAHEVAAIACAGGGKLTHSRGSDHEAAVIANAGGSKSSHSRDSDSGQSSTDNFFRPPPWSPLPSLTPTLKASTSTDTEKRSDRPGYMPQIKLASTKGKIGVHHEQHENEEIDKKVPFSDLEFGYLANWKRGDKKNFDSYRLLPEVIGDNPTSRSI